MSHVHQRLKDYDNAINLLFQVWELYQQIFGSTSLEVASSYLELAQANLKKKDFNEAINFQQKALKVFSEVDQQTVSQDMVADTAITLSEWLEKVERIEEALDVLKQAE